MKPKATIVLLSLLYVLALVPMFFTDGTPALLKVLVVLVGFLGSLVVYYWLIYQPTIRLKEDHVKLLMPDLLEALVRKYAEAHPGGYDLRVSVMRLRRRRWIGA